MAEQDALVCCDDVSSNMNTLLMLDEWILDEPMGHEVEDFNSNTVESWLEATVPDMQTPCVSSSSSSVSHANNNDHRSTTFPELSKIIVKKQVMEKAVERLGGGKKGALMLWGLVQVWLKNRASKSANDSLLQGFLSHESSAAVTNTSTTNPNLNPMCTSTFQFAGPEDSVLPQQSADISSSKLHLVNGARILPAVVDGVARNGNASSCLQQQQQQQQTLNSHFPPSIGQRTSSLAMYRQRDLNEDRVRNSAAVTRAARRSRIAQQRKSSNHTNRSRVATSSSISWSSVLAGSGGGGHASCEHRPRHRNSSEKELRVVLEKDLRPSDVGNLGRIVLPKKEAELHLPILTQREGITVSMEDMTTSNTWKFKYRSREG